MPDPISDEIVTATKGPHSVAVATTLVGTDTLLGFRHDWQDEDRRRWTTEICGWHTPQHFLVGVHLHCATADTGIRLPKPRKPYIVKLILQRIGGDPDGDFQVSAEPRVLAESEIDIATRLLLGQTDHLLPVIYTSCTWNDRAALDATRLAQWAAGMAHVVTEPSRRFSFVLASHVQRTNPYEGAVAIIWPRGRGRAARLYPFNYTDPSKYAAAIADSVRTALATGRPDHRCTWEYVRELIARKKVEALRREGNAKVEAYAKECDTELGLTKQRLEGAEKEIGRLKQDLIESSKQSGVYSAGLLRPSNREKELFAGEHRDILHRALKVACENSQPDGRVRHVLQALLQANKPTGETERIEQGIRDALGSCTNAGKRERRALEELGFSISDDGKHLKLVFRGDDRYTFAMAKTGSDWRGMKNWVSDVTKRLFR